jgi:26S proteasome regulatory subunit N2
VDFVRQGAMISLAMVLQQAAEARSPSVRRCKEHCQSVAQDKHQPIVAKQGAIIALGMLEAGAGNVAVSLAARAGFLKAGACVGMMLFLQHWYWYPLLPAVSLALQPTAIIGLNADLNMPKGFSLLCSAPPSTFAYLKWEEKKEEEKKPMATAVLSTTAKAKAREAKKEAKKHGGVGRQISSQMSIEKTASVNADDKDKDLALGGIPLERVTSHLSTVSYLSVDADPKAQAAAEKAKKLREPTSFTVPNVSRVVPAQWKFLSLPPDQRYRPVRGGHRTALAGILLLQDGQPGEAEEVQKVEKLGAFQESEMAPAPEPFEWDPNDE